MVKNGSKVCVIGLDGVPYTLLKEYMDKGQLPGFKKILESGFKLHQMDASIPDVSSTSWTSFMTGVNPAEHGIYGFMELAPGSYQLTFPNSSNIKAPAVWDIIGDTAKSKSSTLFEKYKNRVDNGLRSIVLNIPQTYPATSLNGILTAGFVAPDLKKGTYPESAYNYLQSIGYISDVNSNKAKDDKDAFFDDLFLALEKRVVAYEHFMKNEPWDLFIGVITETDRLHHFFFDAAYDREHAYHSKFNEFFHNLDEAVKNLFDEFMEQTSGNGLFITLSDHGFTKIENEVYINRWLQDEGFLKLDRKREYFDQIDSGSTAFALDPARIYVNIDGKYPRGSVKESEKSRIAAELMEKLKELKGSNDKPVIREIHGNSELYDGPLAQFGPDLVCLAHDGFDLKGTLMRDEVFGKTHFTGMHTSYDAHCILPRNYNMEEKLHIEKIADLMLHNFANGSV
ncbi:MAG: alkaline phosphatase family protein [bacterium]